MGNRPPIDIPFFGILVKISQNWENDLIKIIHVENCVTYRLPLPREFAKIAWSPLKLSFDYFDIQLSTFRSFS